MVAGERIGVLQLLNRVTGSFTNYEVALLAKFASLAAVAVRNARHFGDMAARIGAYGVPRDSVDAATLRRLLNAPAQSERVSMLANVVLTAVGRAVNLASALVIDESRQVFKLQIKSVGASGPDYEVYEILRLCADDGGESAASVLLVSPTFLSSEFIDRHELPPPFEAAEWHHTSRSTSALTFILGAGGSPHRVIR